MFSHGEISTEVDKKPFFFTVAAAAVSTAAAVLLFVLGRGNALAIFSGVLVAVVAAAAFAVLFAMLTDYAYVRDGVLTTRYLFKKRNIPFSDIGRVTCTDKVYRVFDRNGNVTATVNGMLTGIDKILYSMEKNGVRFE